MKKIAIIGTAYPFRGGLAAYNERLAQQFIQEGYTVDIYTFTLQYPNILFPGKSQYSQDPPPPNLNIIPCINSINPFNWIKVGLKIKKQKYNYLVCKYWLPFMAPCLGTILKLAKSQNITILDNVIPHEKRIADNQLTKYFLKQCHQAIAMSQKVLTDFKTFEPQKKVTLIPHPLYDNFGQPIPKAQARQQLNIAQTDKVILFFGFIRNYKGLQLLLEAMLSNQLQNQNIKLILAGEYYEDPTKYQANIQKLKAQNRIWEHTYFIPDTQVAPYFCAADVVVQPYINATQSGVTPLAYHFNTPMIVTNVGGLPDMVPHQKVGLVCNPTAQSIQQAITQIFITNPQTYIPNIIEQKKQYSWANITNAITQHN